MNAKSLIVLLVTAAFVLSGCLSGEQVDQKAAKGPRGVKRVTPAGGFVGESWAGSVDTNRTEKPTFDFTKAIDATHGGVPGGHAIRKLHEGSYGLKLAGYDPLVSRRNPTAYDSGFVSIDVWGDNGTAYYACVTHFAGNGGVDIVDITDPKKPKMVSFIDSGQVNSDCQFTDDGKYLFLGSYDTNANLGQGSLRDLFRQVPVAGLWDLLAAGVSVWDVRDKANPKYVLFSETGNYHNLFTVTIDGVYYLMQTGTKFIYKFDPASGGKISKVAETKVMKHDMTVTRHPLTGDWYLLTGKGQGVAFYLFNDPTNPIEVGEWAAQRGAAGWHEQEVIPHLVDGRALAIVAGEVSGGTTEPYGIIDWTDPSMPVLVGTWDIPGKPVSNQPNFFTFSPHEIYTWNGYVAVANYHAGVWVFDVGSAERMREPVTIGYYLPHEEPALYGAPHNPPFAFNPDTWGAYFDDRGYVVTADWGSGLYILEMPATGTWTPPLPSSHN